MLLLRNSISNTKKFLQRTIDTFKSFLSKGNNMYERLPKPKTPPFHPFLCGQNPTDNTIDLGIESGCSKDLDNFYSEFTHRWDSNKAKNKGQNRAKTQKNEKVLTVTSQKMALSETQEFCTEYHAEKRRGFLRNRAKTQTQKTALSEDHAEKGGLFLKNRAKTQKNEEVLTVTSQKMTLSETDHTEKRGGFLKNRAKTHNQKTTLSETQESCSKDRVERRRESPKSSAKTPKTEEVLTDTSQQMTLSETEKSCTEEDPAEKGRGSVKMISKRQLLSSDVCSRSVRERRLCSVAEKLKKLGIINEEDEGGSSSVDVEEILHYYSRLTCPAYLDIVDKFFTEMCAEFLGSQVSKLA